MISVIVPVYNVEKYIEDCIQSILQQTYKDFELLLIDDGSQDRSGQICDQYAKQDARIHVFHTVNQGVSAARNFGIKHAKGDYICFVDSDDFVEKEYLYTMNSYMQPGGMVSCKMYTETMPIHSKDNAYFSPEEGQISVFSAYGMGGGVGKLFDMEIIKKHDLFYQRDLAICEDLLFSIQYLRYATAEVVWIASTLYFYRKNQDGAVRSRFSKLPHFDYNKLTEITALERCQQYLFEGKEIEKAWKARMVKAAVNTLRTMCANHYVDLHEKRRLRRFVLKNVLSSIISPYLIPSAKSSICLSAISIKLELLVWKLNN